MYFTSFFSNPVIIPQNGQMPCLSYRGVIKSSSLQTSLFSDNSLAVYPVHSLNSSVGGNGVRNAKRKGRRT